MISMEHCTRAFRSGLQVVMEHVRQKSNNLLSWPEIMKEAKIVMMEKRTTMDAEDSRQVAMFYEKLRSNVPVMSTRDLVVRLEDISNRCRLRFLRSPGSSGNCFITSEYFFVEIVLGEDATAVQVFVTHGENQAAEECIALRNIINSRQWELLELNLKGLRDVYIENADRETKKAAFAFLKSLEAYLFRQNANTDSLRGSSVCNAFMAPFDYFVPREAGIPGRIYYFCSPSSLVLSVGERVEELTFSKMLASAGVRYAELLMESTAETQLLEIATNGSTEYQSLCTCAIFTLTFKQPLVVTLDALTKIEQFTGFAPETLRKGRMLNLLLSKDTSAPLKSLLSVVILSDQSHVYSFSDESCLIEAAEVKKIFWRNTESLANVMGFVRSMATFNHVVSTCLRNILDDGAAVKEEWRCVYTTFSTWSNSIDCVFEYTQGDFFTIKFLLFPQMRATVCLPSSLETTGKDLSAIATNVLSRFWSIPIAVRAVLKALLPSSVSEPLLSPPCNGKWSNSNGADDPPVNDSEHSDTQNFNVPSLSCLANNTMHMYTLNGKESGKVQLTAKERINRLSASADTVLAMAAPRVFSDSLPNMLNLFKQVTMWKELIPPRLIVRKVPPRPAKFVPAASPVHEHSPILAPPTPIVSAVCSQAAAGGAAAGPSPKNRHFSSTSETLTELDELCQLSSSFTEGGRSSVALNSPDGRVVDGPINAGDSSIQNTIECVVGSVKAAPSYAMGNVSFKHVPSEGTNLLASIRNLEFNVFGQRPYVGKSATDPGEQHDRQLAPSCAAEQGAPGPNAMGSWQSSQQQRDLCAVRGMLVTRGVRRRRSRKPLGNTSDRTMEMVLKELRKAERMARGAISRRPRKARRCATANVLMRSDAFAGPEETSKFTLKIRPTIGTAQVSSGVGDGVVSHGDNDQMPTLDVAAPSRLSTDDMLRKQLKAVAREVISDVQLTPLESTDFDSPSSGSLDLPADGGRYGTSVRGTEPGGRFSSTSELTKSSGACYATTGIKAPKRKNSLDAVIGKLMDKVGTSPSERRIDHDDNFGDVFGDPNLPYLKKSRLDSISDATDNANRPSSSDMAEAANEGIKLVIKKSVIKMGASSKSTSTRGKTGSPAKKSSPTMGHRAQSVSPPLLKTENTILDSTPGSSRSPSGSKFELLRQKMQARKLKKQPITEKAKTKSKKAEKRSVDYHTTDDQTERKMLEKPDAKLSPSQLPAVFPGTEGIIFSRSLKNFKIPKIEDTSAKVPVSAPSTSASNAGSTTTSVTSHSAAQVPSEGSSAERTFSAQPSEDFTSAACAPPTTKCIPRKPFPSMLHQPSPKPILRNHTHPHSIPPIAMSAMPPPPPPTPTRYRHGDNVEVSPSLPIPRYVRRTLLPNPPIPAPTNSPPPPTLQRPVAAALSQSVPMNQARTVVSPTPLLGNGGQAELAADTPDIPNLKVAIDVSKESAPDDLVQLVPSPDASALVIDDAPAASENVESLTDGSDVLSPGLQIAIEECVYKPTTTEKAIGDCDKVEGGAV
uniref:Mediator of RNA polymerase II transcription subunit 1 n=1 Tax=Trichuris muris TaxID=70415 RepID=A0A5S6QTH4_TRIMR